MPMPRPITALGPEALLAHREWIERLARAFVLGSADAEDVAQQVWVNVLARTPATARTHVRSWLRAALQFKAIDARRAAHTRSRHEAAAARAERADVDPADLVAGAEMLNRVARAVLELEDGPLDVGAPEIEIVLRQAARTQAVVRRGSVGSVTSGWIYDLPATGAVDPGRQFANALSGRVGEFRSPPLTAGRPYDVVVRCGDPPSAVAWGVARGAWPGARDIEITVVRPRTVRSRASTGTDGRLPSRRRSSRGRTCRAASGSRERGLHGTRRLVRGAGPAGGPREDDRRPCRCACVDKRTGVRGRGRR